MSDQSKTHFFGIFRQFCMYWVYLWLKIIHNIYHNASLKMGPASTCHSYHISGLAWSSRVNVKVIADTWHVTYLDKQTPLVIFHPEKALWELRNTLNYRLFQGSLTWGCHFTQNALWGSSTFAFDPVVLTLVWAAPQPICDSPTLFKKWFKKCFTF